MRSQQLLYLSAYQLVAYRWQAGTLSHTAAFADSEEGYRQFADYLRQHARERFALLVNIAEEGFHVETIPFLRGADREAVIRRKLGQIFFNAPLTASQSLGHEKNKRKDERLLLAALTGSEHLAPWLKIIVVRKLRCWRALRAMIPGSSVGPSTPQFQERLFDSPSLLSSPLASLCLSL